MEPKVAPHVAIVIVNYRGRIDTLECLRSLQGLTYPNYSVVVVDQASDDGTPDAIRAEFADVTVIENPINDGFSGGNNLGAERALEQGNGQGADYLFLLNNDTTVAPDLLDLLVTTADNKPDIGIVGPLMLYYGQPDTIWSAGGTIAPRGDSTMRDQGRVVRAEDSTDPPFPVDFVVGCGLLIKRAAWEAVGPMDDRYFLYYEEADLCVRAHRAGWEVLTVPAARLWHKVSQSTGTGSDLTLYYMRRNVLRFLRRTAPGTLAAVLRPLHSAVDTLYLASVWMLRGDWRRARVLLWALTDYGCGRMGKSGRF